MYIDLRVKQSAISANYTYDDIAKVPNFSIHVQRVVYIGTIIFKRTIDEEIVAVDTAQPANSAIVTRRKDLESANILNSGEENFVFE